MEYIHQEKHFLGRYEWGLMESKVSAKPPDSFKSSKPKTKVHSDVPWNSRIKEFGIDADGCLHMDD